MSADLANSSAARDLARNLAADSLNPATDEQIRVSVAEAIGGLAASLEERATHALEFAGQLVKKIRDVKELRTVSSAKALAGLSTAPKNSAPAHELARELASKIRDDKDYRNRGDLAQKLAPLMPYLKDNTLTHDAASQLAADIRKLDADNPLKKVLAESSVAITGNIEEKTTFNEMAGLALSVVRGDPQADCGVLALASRPSDLHVIVELLQWPQCASADQTAAVLKVAGERVSDSSGGAKGSRMFGNLNSFLEWVQEQTKNRPGWISSLIASHPTLLGTRRG